MNEEFDLDLTYITERIIGETEVVPLYSVLTPPSLPAMSYPASGVESTYRNNLKDVAKMLKTKHQENYMVSQRHSPFIAMVTAISTADI